MYALDLKARLVTPVYMERGVFEVVWQRLVDVVQARKRRDSKASLGVASSRDMRILEEAQSGAGKYEDWLYSSAVATIKQLHVHFQLFF